MEIKKIFFDMDGVLADFERGVIEILGLSPVNQAKKSRAQDDIMFTAMQKEAHFYNRLHLMHGAKEMFLAVYSRYGDRCEILSGIPKPWRGIVNAGEDKIAWAHRLLTSNIVVNIVYREEKKNFCKGPEYILIDDYEKNIREWEALGGTGILYQDAESTIQKLREIGAL